MTSQPILYGVPQSTFVRAARIALAEKGVAYELRPVPPGAEDGAARHPFGKIPFFRHGELVLAETAAICRYIDRVFPGPALQPEDAGKAALCDQWVSAIADAINQTMVRGVVLPRLVYPHFGRPVDEAAVSALVPQIEKQCAELERALAPHGFLADTRPTLADFFLVPILFYMQRTPEGEKVLPRFAGLGRWVKVMNERPSVKETVPPPVAPPRAG
jgi:glutathione S-transferase